MSASHHRRATLVAGLATAVTAGAGAAIANAQTPSGPPTVSATGTGSAAVTPDNRTSNSSIVAAIARAEQTALPFAFRDAQRRVTAIAQAAGLKLTHLLAVSDPPGSPFTPFGGWNSGSFGPSQYCGNIARYRTRRLANGRVRRTRTTHTGRPATSS